MTTRYRCPSPAERAFRRVTRSPFVEDVRSRLHIIPEVVGALFAAYIFVGLLRGLAVVATIAGAR